MSDQRFTDPQAKGGGGQKRVADWRHELLEAVLLAVGEGTPSIEETLSKLY